MPERHCERQSQCICVRDREESQRLRYVSFFTVDISQNGLHPQRRLPFALFFFFFQSAAEEGNRMEGASRTAVWGHAVSRGPGTRGHHRQRAVGLVW
jgi:hypothetical protein